MMDIDYITPLLAQEFLGNSLRAYATARGDSSLRFESAGIRFAFPTQTVRLQQ